MDGAGSYSVAHGAGLLPTELMGLPTHTTFPKLLPGRLVMVQSEG